jgi:uncharacterized membrane protein
MGIIVKNFEKKFDIGIDILQIISYTISFILITFSIIRSIYRYIIEYTQPSIGHLYAFQHARMDLAESIALSLSFLLGVEILKLFHIQSYRQLIIVVSLVLIKLLISFFLLREIELSKEEEEQIF